MKMKRGSFSFSYQSHECDPRGHDRLRTAIRHKNRECVQKLIEEGVKVNRILEGGYTEFDPTEDPYEDMTTNYAMFTPLHLAVIARDVTIIEILLDKGADINVKVWNGETPLTMAAKMQNTIIVDLLLSNDSITDVMNFDGLSHLHIACMRNNLRVVKKLLLTNLGERINNSVEKTSILWAGFTPLHFAVHFECTETVKFLLNSGADIMIQNGTQCTPLHLADLHRNEEIIDLILQVHKSKFKNPINAEGLSHFHIACTRNDSSVVEHFLRLVKVDVNAEVISSERESYGYGRFSQWEGWRPIHFAMLYECSDVVQLLLKHKIHLEARCFSELLECSYITEKKSIYNLFLTNCNGPSMCSEEFDQELSIVNACIHNESKKIEEWLHNNVISAPSDLNKLIWNGRTPLHIALECQSSSVVKVLLDQGADIMALDAQGRTSLHVAFRERSSHLHDKMVKYFDTFIRPNVTDSEGLSIFHILCGTGNMKAVQKFLQRGVNINEQVGSESARWAGFTALHFAVRYGSQEIVDILLQHGADVTITNGLNLDALDFTLSRLDKEYFTHERDNFDILMKILTCAQNQNTDFNHRGFTHLHELCISENTKLEELQQYLVAHRDEIDRTIESPAYHKYTPLHVIMDINYRLDRANLLLENGANPLITNGFGMTFLEQSFPGCLGLDRSLDEIERLFFLGTQGDYLKPSHFHLACASGSLNTARHLVGNFADDKSKIFYLNFPNDRGQTPLHSLMNFKNHAQSRVEIAKLMIENGADVHAKDFELQTPLHYAPLKKDSDVTRTLIKFGADVNVQNIFGQTPLHKLISDVTKMYTARDGADFNAFCEQVSLLLEEGSNVNIIDRRGQTCLMTALCIRSNELKRGIVSILLDHIKKLSLIGYRINEDNIRSYVKASETLNLPDSRETELVVNCEKELEFMRQICIDRYTSLYDILFKSQNSMTCHCQNVLLQNTIESNDYAKKFPLYGFFIKLQMRNGRLRQPLLNESKKCLASIFGQSLSNQCMEKILDYLSNMDLRNVIDSVNIV